MYLLQIWLEQMSNIRIDVFGECFVHFDMDSINKSFQSGCFHKTDTHYHEMYHFLLKTQNLLVRNTF